jgi:hypothetical protein
VPLEGLPNPEGIRFVHRLAPGRWLIGGDGATLAVYESSGITDVIRGPSEDESFSHASGDFDDIAVLVGSRNGESPALYALISRRWLRPLTLKKAEAVSGVARIGEDRWLVTGRKREGGAFVLIYSPLNWDATPAALPPARALLACSGVPDRGVGLAVGSEGLTVWIESDQVRHTTLPDKPDLSATALSVVGNAWAAGAGQIWLGRGGGKPEWWKIWHDASWTAPFISLFADAGIVIGMTADGGIVEGRSLASLVTHSTLKSP